MTEKQAMEPDAPESHPASANPTVSSADDSSSAGARAAEPDSAVGEQQAPQPPNEAESTRYQQGWSQLPQREPQSNLNQPGQAPVSLRSSAGSAGLAGGATNARTPAALAAKAARKEAAMVKSVGLDGPTRSISRPELVKDMPDLSEVRHPLPPQQSAAPEQPSPSRPTKPTVKPTVRKPSPASVAAAPVGYSAATAGPLRATVQIRRIDPWSTLKITLVISAALFFVWMLAVALLYIVMAQMSVWEHLNDTFTDIVATSGESTDGLIDAGSVFGYAGVLGLINVVLFTAMATIGTFIYNQCCDLVGGIQVTLSDPD